MVCCSSESQEYFCVSLPSLYSTWPQTHSGNRCKEKTFFRCVFVLKPFMWWLGIISVLGVPHVCGRWSMAYQPVKDYAMGDAIPVVIQDTTALKTAETYKAYSLPYCTLSRIETLPESLGELLGVRRTDTFLLELRMGKNQSCGLMCVRRLSLTDVKRFAQAIRHETHLNISADSFPGEFHPSQLTLANAKSVNRVRDTKATLSTTSHFPFSGRSRSSSEEPRTHLSESGASGGIQGDANKTSDITLDRKDNEDSREMQSLLIEGRSSPRLLSSSNGSFFFLSQSAPHSLSSMSALANEQSTRILSGVPVGYVTPDRKHHILFNHFALVIRYRVSAASPQRFIVVGFNITPKSLWYTAWEREVWERLEDQPYFAESLASVSRPVACESPTRQAFDLDAFMAQNVSKEKNFLTVPFTYSVKFVPGNATSATSGFRLGAESSGLYAPAFYDSYTGSATLLSSLAGVRWFPLLFGLVLLILSGVVGTIMFNTLFYDIARYNLLQDPEDCLADETGWQLLHGDVFRRPRHAKLLAVCVGTGVQLLGMVLGTLAVLGTTKGFTSAAEPSELFKTGVIVYTLMGVPGGYVAARFTKLFKRDNLARTATLTCMTTLLFPGVCFSGIALLDLVVLHSSGHSARRLWETFIYLGLWLSVSVPLNLLGAYLGHSRREIALPVRTNQIPRQIPFKRWWYHPLIYLPLTGLFPFCAVLSAGSHATGMLLATALIISLASAEIAIVLTYFELCAEDYNWWWRSFFASASSAFHVLLYAIFYVLLSHRITRFSDCILLFGYTLLVAYAFFFLTGAVGCITTFLFLRGIYGALRID